MATTEMELQYHHGAYFSSCFRFDYVCIRPRSPLVALLALLVVPAVGGCLLRIHLATGSLIVCSSIHCR